MELEIDTTRYLEKPEKVNQALLNRVCSSAIQGVIEEIDYKIAILNDIKRNLSEIIRLI